MNSYLVGFGIRFNDFVFSEPVPLSNLAVPKCAGLFVVLVKDGNWGPRQFQPLCFGEFGNNFRGLIATDANRLPANTGPLFIAVLPMPYSSSAQRCEARNQLVWAYNPAYQGSAAAAPTELARKLDELERKHQEQSTQFQMLLASINRFFEPLPEPARRRPIGFLPQTAEQLD
jgi:hypothetical protein